MAPEVKTKSRFRCETCGRDVPYESKECPYCGAEFAAVRCPRCRYEGPPGRFRDGCPRCGYMASGARAAGKDKSRRSSSGTAGAPLWLYILVLCFLLFLLLILLFRM